MSMMPCPPVALCPRCFVRPVVIRRALQAGFALLTAFAVSLAVTGCSSDRPHAQSAGASTPAVKLPPERYAYLTKGELTVYSGRSRFGPVVGGFSETGKVFWT